jgi:hypothetical protein
MKRAFQISKYKGMVNGEQHLLPIKKQKLNR